MATRKKSVAIPSRQTAPVRKNNAAASPAKAIGIGKTTKPKNPKTLNLALQGGGSHGAFTWGVLDRLLEEERLDIEGISGTSAGAMNAAIFAQGCAKGGRQGAKAELDRFWHKVAELARFSPVHRLRDLLAEHLDVAAIQACDPLKIFICATNVETGHARVFMRHDVTIDALLASACLPFVFQAVEIDGVPYWDGGYMGNPIIYPLIYYCDCRDVAVVQINPLLRKGTPHTATEIINRVNEISFNSSLIAEMRAIAFVQRLIEGDHLKGKSVARLKRIHVHMIGNEEKMRALGVTSKSNADIDFLVYLKGLGRQTAEDWLRANWNDIGNRSSLDIRATFLDAPEPAKQLATGA